MTVVLSDLTDGDPYRAADRSGESTLFGPVGGQSFERLHAPAKVYDSGCSSSRSGFLRDNKSGCGLTLNVALKQVSLVQNRQTKKVNSRTARAQPKSKSGKTNLVNGPAATDSQKNPSLSHPVSQG